MVLEVVLPQMENSLIRPSPARCPSHGERKDTLRTQTRFGRPHCHQLPGSYHQKTGHRISSRRDWFRQVSESLEYEDTGLHKDLTFNQYSVDTTSLADGYAYVSSQLRVFPGTLADASRRICEVPCWNSVAEVSIISETTIKCPICLNFPLLPRMERCGHVYCGPCVVQFIHYDNAGNSKKCAVCSWVMNLEDLKRVKITYVDALGIGSDLDMTLVKRDNVHNSTLKSCAVSVSAVDSKSNVFQFLEEMSWSDINDAYKCDIEVLLRLRNSSLSEGDTELLPHISYLIDNLECKLKETAPSLTLKCGDPTFVDGISTSSHPNHTCCFYQASDGRLIFLDGLMWNCLLSEAGTVANLPNTLRVSVISLRTRKMSTASRKRWRHLSHIPFGRTFTFVDIELTSLVSQRVLDQFASPLEIRFLERNRQLLEDLELTKLKEAAENQIPSLPPGFTISGHADLSDSPNQRLQPSDFEPLCSKTTLQPKPSFSSSFAEVTKFGALSVVDQNRVADFSLNTVNRSRQVAFNPATEIWPTLSVNTQVTMSDVPKTSKDQPKQSSDCQPCSKKHRKRRCRTKSTTDSS